MRNFAGRLEVLILTDCADAYAAIMDGHPNNIDRFGRIGLSYIRDIASLCAILFVGKNYVGPI